MERWLVRGAGRRVAPAHVLLVFILIAGCAVLGRESVHDRDLRRAVQEDQSFTVEEAPEGAPAHRAASFRLAAEGYRALQSGNVREAEDRLEKALSVDPRNPFCYLYLAEIRFREGDTGQALVFLNQAEVQFQGHPYWLGEVYTRKGLYWEALDSTEEAQSAYGKALEYNPWNEESGRRFKQGGDSEG